MLLPHPLTLVEEFSELAAKLSPFYLLRRNGTLFLSINETDSLGTEPVVYDSIHLGVVFWVSKKQFWYNVTTPVERVSCILLEYGPGAVIL